MSRKIKTHQEYVDRLHQTNYNVEVIDQYVDYNTYITHRCKRYGYT